MLRTVFHRETPRIASRPSLWMTGVLGVVLVAATASLAPACADEGGKLLRLTIKGRVFEQEPPLQLFGGSLGTSLQKLLGSIREAREDGSVRGLILRLKNPILGWTQCQALRRELLVFRKSGKPSYCHIDAAGTGTYLLASACGEVSLTPSGELDLPGVSMQLVYMKELFKKIGIEFQELRMGRYKGAVEPLTREEPSKPIRESLQSVLDEYYDELIQSIAENRSLQPMVARALIDRALFSAEDAKEAGLIDHMEYSGEFMERLKKKGHTKITDARLSKKLNLNITGFGGMMQLFNEIMGVGRKRSPSGPRVALVHGEGPIVQSSEGPSLFGGRLMTSDEIVKILRKLSADDSVKGIVFRVNSPGGSGLASDLIWNEVRRTVEKKPVVVSMGDYAASGGYYVSCAANWIVAENCTLTGSIGVIGAIANMKALYSKIGLSVTTLSRGKRAEIIDAYGELSEEGREMLMEYLQEIYDDFLDRVSKGRKLPREAVASIAEGRVWTGGQAKKLGLVDEIGGLNTALARLRKIAGLPEDIKISVYPRPKTFMDMLNIMAGEETAMHAASRLFPEKLKGLLRQVEWLRTLPEERFFTALPQVMRVR